MYSIFKRDTPTQSQFDYKLQFFPGYMLSPAAKSRIWKEERPRAIRKENFLAGCNEDLTHFTNLDNTYKIVWLFNNIPTDDEWTRKSDTYLITVVTREFRDADREDVIILSFSSVNEAVTLAKRKGVI